MKKITLFTFAVFCSLQLFAKKWIVVDNGFTFSPSSLTITQGDSVEFTLDPMHTALEVSQSTWNVNGTTPLSGGFSVPSGGGLVLPAQLGAGTHYYVCEPHASFGMKGTINVVINSVSVLNSAENGFAAYPNPCSNFLNVIYHVDSRTVNELNLYDLNGRLCTQFLNKVHMPGDYQATYELNRHQLERGVYILEQATGGRKSYLKILVE